MVNFNLVIEKVMRLKGITNAKDVAEALGISPQDFSNRKKRGTLLPVLVEWAISEEVSLDWLLAGERAGFVAEPSTAYLATDPVVIKIDQHLEQMTEEAKRDVLKYAEEKELLSKMKGEQKKKKG